MVADKTWLFVPAKEKFVKNFESIEADYIILDLEDSLTVEQKDEGLKLAAETVNNYGKTRNIYVRVNADERFEKEMKLLSSYEFTGFLIPKFEDTSVVEKYQQLIGKKEVIALVESVKGIIHIEHIAKSPLVHRLAFGGEDFCRDLGFGAGEEATLFARNQLVMYASYYKKYSLDGVCLEVRDMDVFMKAYEKTKRMGFCGKLLIHPNQARAVQEHNKKIDVDYLQHVVEVFKNSKEGVIFIDGEFYEKPVIDKIENYLSKLKE